MGQVYYPADSGKIFTFEKALTVTAGAYTALDILGGDFEITNAAKRSGGSGRIVGAIASIEDDLANLWVANDIKLWFFKSNPAGTYADNGTFAITDADIGEVEGTCLLPILSKGVNVLTLETAEAGISIPYTCDATSLWCIAQNVGGRTPDATDAIQLRIKMQRD